MNAKQQKSLGRFGQVLSFLDANTALIAPASVASSRAVLETAVTTINGFAQDQVSKGVEVAQAHSLSAARTALRDNGLRPISTIARTKLTLAPNLRTAFLLPGVRINALALIQAAGAMAAAAQPYAQVFIDNGLPSTFLTDLQAMIQAVQDSVTAEGNSKRVSQGATAGIKAQITAAHAAVKTMDAVIRPALATDKPVWTQWESIKRTIGAPKLSAPVAPPNSVQPIAQPAVSTTPASTTPVSTGSGGTTAPSGGATTSSGSSSAPSTSATPAAA